MFWVWKRMALFFLCIEMLLFGLIYTFGPHGLSMLAKLEQSYYDTEIRCQELKEKIVHMEQGVDEWEHSSFLKEKVARERLLMKKPGETIYFR
jgi:cell division protein FtsB